MLCCFWGASKCLRPKSNTEIYYIFVLRFFPVFFLYFLASLLCFSCCVFSHYFLLCVCGVVSVGVVSFFLPFPRRYLLFRHFICNVFVFCFCEVFFCTFFLFFGDNNMLLILVLCWPCFLLVLFTTSFTCLTLFLPCRFWK